MGFSAKEFEMNLGKVRGSHEGFWSARWMMMLEMAARRNINLRILAFISKKHATTQVNLHAISIIALALTGG